MLNIIGMVLTGLYAITVLSATFAGYGEKRSSLTILISWPVLVPIGLVLALINPLMLVLGIKRTPLERLADYLFSLDDERD